ncbi:MAG: phosphatidate cytidylyltransferase [Planctomycetes bacterium]|nr:phosphatidate cytidylyltransferase [Planctomycetota bacterium]
MSVLGQRCLYGTLLGGAALALLAADRNFGSQVGFTFLCLVFVMGGWLEFSRTSGIEDSRHLRIGDAVVVAAIAGEWWILREAVGGERSLALHVFLPFAVLGALIVTSFRRPPSRASFGAIALCFLGLVYLLLPALCFLRLRFLEDGTSWVLFTLLLAKMNDTGAYFVGRSFGRTPLTTISPKKTWEGALGGLVCGLLVAYAFSSWREPGLFSPLAGTILGVAGGIAGQVGDLAESYWKRAVGAKDSGSMIPALGGALDIMDSVLFCAPVVYLWAVFVGA